MKKLLPVIIVLLMLLSACSSNAQEAGPKYKVKNGAFDCSPQELIDQINAVTNASDEFPQIGEWTGSNDEIEIKGSDLTMYLIEENEKLCSVIVYWKATNSNSTIITKAGILTGMLSTMLLPDPDSIHEKISSAISAGSDRFDATQGNISIHFDTSDIRGTNNFVIQISK